MIVKEEGFFTYFVKFDKVYRKLCDQAVGEYGFTPNEILVMMFLANNPGFDSASDIAHYRNISKGLVAKSVESLCQQGYLTTGKDEKDRRLIHLHLTEKSSDVVVKLKECRRMFARSLYDGVPKEDLDAIGRSIRVMDQNLENILKGMK